MTDHDKEVDQKIAEQVGQAARIRESMARLNHAKIPSIAERPVSVTQDGKIIRHGGKVERKIR